MNESNADIASVPPDEKPRLVNESSTSIPLKPTHKSSGEGKDFFKRVAGLFSKTGEIENSPPPSTES